MYSLLAHSDSYMAMSCHAMVDGHRCPLIPSFELCQTQLLFHLKALGRWYLQA